MAINFFGGYIDLGSQWNYQFPTVHSPMSAFIYHFAGDPTRYDILKRIDWIASDSRVTDREQLHTLINQMGLPIGVELGTQRGLYAKYLLENTNLTLWLIDSWQHIDGYNDIANVSNEQHARNLQATKVAVAPHEHRYNIRKQFSVPAAEEFEDGFFDFVYVDADHSYKGTMDDLTAWYPAWYPKLRSGGLMAGHDFLNGENICGSEFGVRSAVFDFLKDKTHKLYTTKEAWPTWWFIKEE
jgi:predicted O-methyltransferase YrrM